MKRTVEIIVSGKVQGVFYRQSTRDIANELGIKGYIENLENGDVRMIVTGDAEKLEELYQWCRIGPKKAEVKKITKATIPLQEFFLFEIRK